MSSESSSSSGSVVKSLVPPILQSKPLEGWRHQWLVLTLAIGIPALIFVIFCALVIVMNVMNDRRQRRNENDGSKRKEDSKKANADKQTKEPSPRDLEEGRHRPLPPLPPVVKHEATSSTESSRVPTPYHQKEGEAKSTGKPEQHVETHPRSITPQQHRHTRRFK